jgi:uncharacterized protein YicC (UPF0701 family)
MIQSMTGFVKQLFNYQPKKITVEVKSLNSKGLDLNECLLLPRNGIGFTPLKPRLKEEK